MRRKFMIARKNNNLIEISFKYDPQIISFVKSLEGRKYNAGTRSWYIPLAGALPSIEKLAGRGFMIEPELWEAVKQDQNKAKEAEALALMPDTEFSTFLPLYGFQRVCSAFMVKTGSCLNACGVGTGKTVMTLAAVVKIKSEKNLVICPKSLMYQWESEILRFTPQYKIFIVIGNLTQRKEVYKKVAECPDPYFLIMSYDIARIDRDIIGGIMPFNTIIYDEGHRLGNVRTKTYKAIQKISQGSQHRYALTATPMMNRPPELYGLLNTIQPGCLGSYQSFLDRYTVRNQWGGMLFPINQSELAQRLKRYMIRKSLEEVAPEMPAMTIEDIPFDLSEKERTLYDKLKKELLFEVEKYLIEKIERPMVIQMTLTKMLILTELTCSLELLGEDKTSSKLEILKERLEDILVDGDNKVIIFSRFEKMTSILFRELQKYNPLLITGKITGENRDLVVQKFQKDETCKLLISTDAGGEGLNLDRGNIIFHYDLPWSIGKYMQRNGRIKRLLQKKPTMVYNLVARKSMDGYMSKVLRAKARLSDTLLGDTPISMDQIREMLRYES